MTVVTVSGECIRIQVNQSPGTPPRFFCHVSGPVGFSFRVVVQLCPSERHKTDLQFRRMRYNNHDHRADIQKLSSMLVQRVEDTWHKLREERKSSLEERRGKRNSVASGSKSGFFMAKKLLKKEKTWMKNELQREEVDLLVIAVERATAYTEEFITGRRVMLWAARDFTRRIYEHTTAAPANALHSATARGSYAKGQ